VQGGAWGRQALMDRDRTTWTGARASWRGVEPSNGGTWSHRPDTEWVSDSDYEVCERRMQTLSQLTNAGSRPKPLLHREGTA
jgi:hypothetical protein